MYLNYLFANTKRNSVYIRNPTNSVKKNISFIGDRTASIYFNKFVDNR